MTVLNEILARLRVVLQNFLDSLRRTWDNLSEREQRLATIMGGVAAFLFLVLPWIIVFASISSRRSEAEEIGKFVRELRAKEQKIAEQRSARQIRTQRYAQPPPPLGTYVASKGKSLGLTITNVTDEPNEEADGYVRHALRVQLANVSLSDLVQLFSAIDTPGLPIAIHGIEIDHAKGTPHYTSRFTVVAYERRPGAGDGRDKKRIRPPT